MLNSMLHYIKRSPDCFHAVETLRQMLLDAGYVQLPEGGWTLEQGGKYFTIRSGSSLIAFRVPTLLPTGFLMSASHSDSPCFRIRDHAELRGAYTRLSVERYGGMLCSTWMDRPLSVAGRVTVRTENGISVRLVDLREPCAIIPNVAIHMNRSANENASYNAAVDMLPLFGTADAAGSFKARVAKAAGAKPEDILTTDLIVYNPQEGYSWNGYISAPRLDDLQCAFGSLEAFLGAKGGASAKVYCLFDNEEVGSQTKQGAASTFLSDVLERIGESLGLSAGEQKRKIANSFLLSCDNAHAVHPNHPEYMDKNHPVYMNRGIVIKYNANQRYTSDAVSAALFQLVCEEAGVPFQRYANRADMAGGSTLGNISNTQVSLNTVDIGLPQLAMHSAFETAGGADTEYFVRALTLFFEKSLSTEKDGEYSLV